MSRQDTLGGTHGRIAHVDLTLGKVRVETPSLDIYRRLVGGRALAAYLLLRDMPSGADALGPDNILVFAPGILQGTNLPGTGRHGIAAKSPAGGAIASSEAGGWWGHELKRAGLDALVVHGHAEQPVYLWITDGNVEIRPAGHLWGKETGPVEALIRSELSDDKVRVAQIGVGGENQARIACVMHDVNRAAGRGGLGAVMGSKRLKAVAVRGRKAVPVADRAPLAELGKWLGSVYEEEMVWAVKRGTIGGIINLGKIGALPTRNFRDPMFDGREGISGALMMETIRTGRDTCAVCPVRCKQVVEYHDPAGRYSLDPIYGGPEYESMAALGSYCCVSSLHAMAKANERCAAYGLDTISAGSVIAFVMECVEKGLLTAQDTGGYLPQWGDGDAMLQGIEMMARSRGFGAKMSGGVQRLAAEVGRGSEELAMHVKGVELPMHEPRLKAGMGLGYAVAPVGADHMMDIHDTSYSAPGGALERVNAVYPVGPLPPGDLGAEKVNLFYHEVNWQHFLDCAVVCMHYPYDYQQMATALTAATGTEYTIRDVLAVGERAQTLSRLFNYQEGLTESDDRLPRRVMKPFDSGPLAGIEITPESFATARRSYYELMGWDPDTGRPTPERVAALGLAGLI
ncbi:MAG TPA: aldehyde ferredoxin oxidoreductase family protein [Anaerolineae bacterium]|nr:aldehyde ferredoxin oxidoreductase family protein [Anaerolineae bacterium]